MQIKKAYHLQTVFDISEAEKESAERLLIIVNYLTKHIRLCQDHLKLMKDPFAQKQGLDKEKLFQHRVSLRKYRDKVLENFRYLKKISFRLFVILQKFAADTQIKKIVNSFVNILSDTENQVDKFVQLFDSINSDTFVDEVVLHLDNINKELEEYKNIIEERIIPFVKTNILNRTWIDNISHELNEKIEKEVPLAVQLSKDINEAQ